MDKNVEGIDHQRQVKPEDVLDNDRLQITQAAKGMVSGKLGEWPVLHRALKKRGYNLSRHMPATEVKLVCQDYCKNVGIEV